MITENPEYLSLFVLVEWINLYIIKGFLWSSTLTLCVCTYQEEYNYITFWEAFCHTCKYVKIIPDRGSFIGG